MARKASFKKERLQDKIRDDLNQVMRQEINDPRFQFVSFSKVELNDDCSHAIIYWDSYDPKTKSAIASEVHNLKGRLRGHLAKILESRIVPDIMFKEDLTYEAEKEIEDLLKKENL